MLRLLLLLLPIWLLLLKLVVGIVVVVGDVVAAVVIVDAAVLSKVWRARKVGCSQSFKKRKQQLAEGGGAVLLGHSQQPLCMCAKSG